MHHGRQQVIQLSEQHQTLMEATTIEINDQVEW